MDVRLRAARSALQRATRHWDTRIASEQKQLRKAETMLKKASALAAEETAGKYRVAHIRRNRSRFKDVSASPAAAASELEELDVVLRRVAAMREVLPASSELPTVLRSQYINTNLHSRELELMMCRPS